MMLLLQFVLLAAGLALLVGGGDTLVRGASGLAKALRISPLVIGLTIVAFGTSAPELAVNILAAWQGKGGISFGNIIGSNLANLGLVLGAAALIRPLRLRGIIVAREIPMMILATVAVFALAMSPWLDGGEAVYRRTDGVMLFLLFSIFLYYTAQDIIRQRNDDHYVRELSGAERITLKGMSFNVFLFFVGLVALIGGGQMTVSSAVHLARHMGVSEDMIGLTIVAVGTSLPELVTAVMATLRGESDLAVGNVVGSNIFNLLLVLALSAVAGPIPVPSEGYADLCMLLFLSVALLPIAVSDYLKIVRGEGVLLMLIYFVYIGWRIF